MEPPENQENEEPVVIRAIRAPKWEDSENITSKNSPLLQRTRQRQHHQQRQRQWRQLAAAVEAVETAKGGVARAAEGRAAVAAAETVAGPGGCWRNRQLTAEMQLATDETSSLTSSSVWVTRRLDFSSLWACVFAIGRERDSVTVFPPRDLNNSYIMFYLFRQRPPFLQLSLGL